MAEALEIAFIRNNKTGEVRRSVSKRDPEYDDNVEFMWTDGNYGCDCNRALFFARAAGDDEPDIDCGEEAYSVLRVEDETGRILYGGDSKVA